MNRLLNKQNLDDVLQLGEGQYIEFKEIIDKIFAKEIVAFANASGGIIYLGITDSNVIKGVSITNKLKSQIQDIAHNCDPSIIISLIEMNNVLAVEIKEGNNKPYSCSAGFFMRMGANSQKMNRNEILELAIKFAVDYLRERVPVRYEINKLARDEFPEYPIEAYREAIVNAVIHFDYFLGDAIAIEKLKSSIIINNKGELLFPEKDFGKRSEARNRLLADLLSRTEYMEKAGTGIKRVTDACKANGNNYIFDFTDSFWVTIESNINENILLKVPDKVPDYFTENQQKILRQMEINNRVSMSQIAENVGISKRKVLDNINKLRNNGIIARIGSTKTGYWEIIGEKGVSYS